MSIVLDRLHLKNPIIIAAGPWARDKCSIQKCIDNGAAAVTTETITLEAHNNLSPHIYMQNSRMYNTKMFSDLDLEQWEKEINAIDKKDSKLICSIWGSSASEISYLASKVERMGADAIEISLFSPIGTRNRMIIDQPEAVSQFVKAAVTSVNIPIFVKLSYEICNVPTITKSIYDAGVHVVSAIDGFKGIMDVDIESNTVEMPTCGGLTGDLIRPMSLATTATLKQNTQFQICSVGGISTYEHVLEFIMLGADAIQLASAIQVNGYKIISRITSGVQTWLHSHGYNEISDIRGKALSSLLPFEDIKTQPLIATLKTPCFKKCKKCINACLYGAIDYTKKRGVTINPSCCIGCGSCIAFCPYDNIIPRLI